MNTIYQFPTLLSDAYAYLEARKDQTKTLVVFIEEEDGSVTYLSTGHDIALLYLITKRIEAEMNAILAEKYEDLDDED